MSDYPMLISNKLHSFRNFTRQIYKIREEKSSKYGFIFSDNIKRFIPDMYQYYFDKLS